MQTWCWYIRSAHSCLITKTLLVIIRLITIIITTITLQNYISQDSAHLLNTRDLFLKHSLKIKHTRTSHKNATE